MHLCVYPNKLDTWTVQQTDCQIPAVETTSLWPCSQRPCRYSTRVARESRDMFPDHRTSTVTHKVTNVNVKEWLRRFPQKQHTIISMKEIQIHSNLKLRDNIYNFYFFIQQSMESNEIQDQKNVKQRSRVLRIFKVSTHHRMLNSGSEL